MTTTAPEPVGESFLLEQFRTFHAEVVELKRLVRSGAWSFADSDEANDADGADGADDDTDRGGATAISQRLLVILEKGAQAAARRGGTYGITLYRDAQYVMAAFADEVFLHFQDWDGKAVWQDNLLETRLFGTYVAGERLFSNLDTLLASRDPVHADLAAVYLMALTLGFRGRYRGDGGDGGRLDAYKRQLRQFISGRHAGALEARPLTAAAYAHTLDEGDNRTLPDPRPWVAAIVAIVVAFLAISHGLWMLETGPLRAIVAGTG